MHTYTDHLNQSEQQLYTAQWNLSIGTSEFARVRSETRDCTCEFFVVNFSLDHDIVFYLPFSVLIRKGPDETVLEETASVSRIIAIWRLASVVKTMA